MGDTESEMGEGWEMGDTQSDERVMEKKGTDLLQHHLCVRRPHILFHLYIHTQTYTYIQIKSTHQSSSNLHTSGVKHKQHKLENQ